MRLLKSNTKFVNFIIMYYKFFIFFIETLTLTRNEIESLIFDKKWLKLNVYITWMFDKSGPN